jgi:hypothetical protein
LLSLVITKTTERSMTMTAQQSDRLKRAHSEITEVLLDLGVLEPSPQPPADPQWLRDTAKQWGLLNALATDHAGDVSREKWSRLGRQHGYDPRGLGGFFVGSRPLMESAGDRRVLTDHGRRHIERWRSEFGA